jgi:myo-inositol catabolism protein IolC
MTRRYRCSNCGNVTRFDVTAVVRSRCYYHYALDGELTVEDTEDLSRVIEEVSCRWCGTSRFVEVLEPAHDGETA